MFEQSAIADFFEEMDPGAGGAVKGAEVVITHLKLSPSVSLRVGCDSGGRHVEIRSEASAFAAVQV